jgi:branched-chain amino acid aminotransferase
VDVVLCQAVRSDPNAKVLDTRARRLADQRIEHTGAYEALLVDREGYITEGSRSNVFFVKGSGLVTPPDNDVLQGIARKNILRICNKEKIDVQIHKVHLEELSDFHAVFLSGTTPKILPVKKIDQYVYSTNHYLLRFLMDTYDQQVQAYVQDNSQ